MHLVQDFLECSAERLPDKTALVCGGRRFAYGDLDRMANRLARALQDLGVGRGDRVGIFLPNGLEAVVAIFATLKAGGVFVVIHPSTKGDKLRYILNNCEASALVAEAKGEGLVMAGEHEGSVPSLKGGVLCGGEVDGAEVGGTWSSFSAVQEQGDVSCPVRCNIDLDLACLIYTSGSTGEPKGVMSDHSNVVFASGSIIQYVGNVESDVVVNVLPLSFDYGLYQLLMTFRFGGTLVLEKGFAFPAALLQLMEREGVTGFPGVPTLYSILLRMDLSAFDLSSLRYLTNTAAALPASHIQEIQQKFPQATLFSMYGLTETKRTLYLPPEELGRRPGSVGVPIPGTEAWLEDDQGHRVGAGGMGELVVRGRHVMRGYWNAPEATAKRFRKHDGFERVCCTGDLFRTDAEGFFYFVGRKDDIIKCRGEKVAPKEVENVLYALPGVAEAAVIGVPDPVFGQAIKAFVVVSDVTITEQVIQAHCRKNLEDLMLPKYIELRAELPKNNSGKIDKKALSAEGIAQRAEG